MAEHNSEGVRCYFIGYFPPCSFVQLWPHTEYVEAVIGKMLLFDFCGIASVGVSQSLHNIREVFGKTGHQEVLRVVLHECLYKKDKIKAPLVVHAEEGCYISELLLQELIFVAEQVTF